MKKMTALIPAASMAAMLAISGAAFAQQINASATTDLNIRSGPGPQYPVVGVIKNNDGVTIEGCIQGSQWCDVNYNGTDGWAYGKYLTAEHSGSQVVLAERSGDLGVPTVTYKEDTSGGAAAGAVTGAVAGAIIGGPIGAAAGAAAGAAVGLSVDPPAQAVTYVRENPHDPVYLDGEVVVGARLPASVELRPIPDYEYSYVYVNGQPVLVENQNRQIVYVVR